VDQSGEMLQEIVGAAQKVNTIVAQIAAATREQSAGISEINGAIAKLNEMTAQNADLVEEHAASATTLLTQSNELNEAMDGFQVSESQARDRSGSEGGKLGSGRSDLGERSRQSVLRRVSG
jgi:methyl-accepting chemotaxis protein